MDNVTVSVPGGGAGVEIVNGSLYIPPGKIGFWQIAYREEDAGREEVLEGVRAGLLTVDLLYGDYEGGQRVISRFGVFREGDAWRLSVVRHWQVDRPNPR
jgi:hypothetical protein